MSRKAFAALLVAIGAGCAWSDVVLFEDAFAGELGEGWSWVRENPDGWRLADGALEIRIVPGNMWGVSNNAQNVLVRPLPEHGPGPIIAECTFENTPTHLYEQVDLVWYYDDGHMVKIGLELVHDQLSMVMGREENDRARTLGIIPYDHTKITVRFIVEGDRIRGQYRANEDEPWREAGKGDLPANGEPKISIQTYQGGEDGPHWARITNFRIYQPEPAASGDEKP